MADSSPDMPVGSADHPTGDLQWTSTSVRRLTPEHGTDYSSVLRIMTSVST